MLYPILPQLLVIEQKLKNENEEQEVQSRINRLNDMRGGTPKAKDGTSGGTSGSGAGGSGGGTGLINTFKKLKGKKKKQRNMTAPEISTQDIKAAMTDDARTTSLTPVKEDSTEKKEGRGKGIFGKKQTPKTSKTSTTSTPGETVFRNLQVDVQDDHSLSQRSDHTLSQPMEHLSSDADIVSPTDAKSKSSMSDVIILEPLNLSQTSGKHSGVSLSQSDAFGNEEHLSTQSSVEIPISNSLLDSQHNMDNSNAIWDNREVVKEEDEDEEEEGRYNRLSLCLQGSSALYADYGSKQHKLNLERVQEFLESSGEVEPKDLSVLQDWDGWMVASREIM